MLTSSISKLHGTQPSYLVLIISIFSGVETLKKKKLQGIP